MRFFLPALLAVSLFLLPGRLPAQVGATTDILTGVVSDEENRPVAGALVEAVSLEIQVSRMARTDGRGRYTILFPDGGGQYRLVVRLIGMIPVERLVVRQADEDRLVTDVVMQATPTQLEEIVVRANRGPPIGAQVPSPGSTERAFTPDQTARLPIDGDDLLLLATLVPGVVALDATDTSAAAISVAGQRPTANSVTLDGLQFGGSQVPQEAVRSTRVVTNTYDAARGQFSGGQIASVTRSGTNLLQGNFAYSLRDRGLTLDAGSEDALVRGFNQHQLSGGLGGPIVRNRLFWFGSLQGRLRSDELTSLLHSPAGSLQRLGASPDSVSRFLAVTESFGLPITTPGVGQDRATDDFSGLARMDWTVSDAHSLAVRGDWRINDQEPNRIGTLALPQTGGTSESRSGGVMATLTSRFGTQVLNEMRAYLSGSEQESDPLLVLPQGRVQVASALGDGTQGVSTFTFGGSTSLPQRSSGTTLEASNEVSWLPGSGAHRIKIGALYSERRSSQQGGFNANGTFTFNSLADLESGTPASFTRTLTPNTRDARTREGAVYVADTWRRPGGLQLTYGLRVEASRLGETPAPNPLVESLFGLRTDRLPSEVHLSPRLGFSWIVGGGGNTLPAVILRGGIGEFRSAIPGSLVNAVQGATGLATGQSQLVCIGDAAPVPDWSAYLDDPGTIPTACADAASPVPTRLPTVTTFDEEFGAPRAWRASLGATKRFGLRGLSFDLSHARGVSQWGYRDLNLASNPSFTLVGEGGRPVYVPAATIASETGTPGLFASRRYPELGQVLVIGSDLESRTTQVALSTNGLTRRGVIYNASYTWSRSRDQSGGGGFAAATTAGDPNGREWATSDFERRHSLLTTVTYPVGGSLELTAIGRLTSGVPYTPMVGSDINGDGARNDRAFVFQPTAASDTALANGMSRLLDATSGGARSCLEEQLGRVAERNSCRGPWQPAFDLQLNWRPDFWGLSRRLNVSVTTVNLISGIDRLIHAEDNLAGWGQSARPDGTLLYVTGFDPVTARYSYTVNERFGAARQTATAFQVPFQIGFQVRYTLGPDRQRDMLQALRGGAGGGGAGRGLGGPGGARGAGGGPGGLAGRPGMAGGDSAGGFLARLESLVPNPARQVLEIRLGLRLTDAQTASLTAVADTFSAEVARLADSVRTQVEKAGTNPDPGRLFGMLRPVLEAGQARHRASLEAIQRILTPEQWAQVPERIKAPPMRMGAVRRER